MKPIHLIPVALAAALGTFVGGWLVLQTREPSVPVVREQPSVIDPVPVEGNLLEIADIQRQLAAIRQMLSGHTSESGSPQVSKTPPTIEVRCDHEDPTALREAMSSLELRLEAVEKILKEEVLLEQPPDFELLQSARPSDATALIAFAEAFAQDKNAATATALWQDHAAILRRFGQPEQIERNGAWHYWLRGHPGIRDLWVSFQFLEGHVVSTSSGIRRD